MSNKDSILVWVNDDNKSKWYNSTKILCHKLNLSLTGLYTDIKNVHYSNIDSFNFNNIIVHSKNSSNTILQNKIKKIDPIFMLIPCNHNNVKNTKNTINILMILKKLNIPFLLLPEESSIINFNNVITFIEYTKKSKDRIMWANYWGKKLSSRIEILFPTERDANILNNIKNNVYFAEKLLKQSKNNYGLHKTRNKSEKILKDAIKLAETKTDSFIILSTKEITFLPYIFKPFEIKIINNYRKNPVFFVPPTDDSLIPCH